MSRLEHGLCTGLTAAFALCLAGGALAQTASIDNLPGQVAGVVGSGDRLSLRLKDGDTPRTLEIGGVYDGWTLRRLTPAVASFAKGGQTRQVGLNPGGVAPPTVGSGAADPQQDAMLSGLRPGADITAVNPRDRAALIDQLAKEPDSPLNRRLAMIFHRTIDQWTDAAGKGQARPGLSLEETQRFIQESIEADKALQDMGVKGLSRFNYPHNRAYALGGDEGDDYQALFDRTNAAMAAQQAAQAGGD